MLFFFAKNRNCIDLFGSCAFFFLSINLERRRKEEKIIISNRINNNNFGKRSNVMLTSSFLFFIALLLRATNSNDWNMCDVCGACNLLHAFSKNRVQSDRWLNQKLIVL